VTGNPAIQPPAATHIDEMPAQRPQRYKAWQTV